MNKKGFASIALAIFVVLLVGAVGYFVLRKPTISSPTQSAPALNQSSQNSSSSDLARDVATCLSGSMTNKMLAQIKYGVASDPRDATLILDPDVCTGAILETMISKENPSSKEVINFCLNLSTDKLVRDTQTSYRDYCIYNVGTYLIPNNSLVPDFSDDFKQTYLSGQLSNQQTRNALWATYQAKLCDVYGSSTNSENNKNQCLIHFINLPLYPDDKMTGVYCKELGNDALAGRCQILNGTIENVSLDLNKEPILPNGNVSGTTLIAEKKGSDSWFAISIKPRSKLISIAFDLDLVNPTVPQALLTVYVSTKQIGQKDGRLFGAGTWHEKFSFDPINDSNNISFRLNTFADGTSSARIRNVVLGYIK